MWAFWSKKRGCPDGLFFSVLLSSTFQSFDNLFVFTFNQIKFLISYSVSSTFKNIFSPQNLPESGSLLAQIPPFFKFARGTFGLA